MNIICYASLEDENCFNLKEELQKSGINCEIDTDFASVIAKAKNRKPDVLLLDYHDYIRNSVSMDIFREGTMFSVPLVLIAGEGSAISLETPLNYYQLSYKAIPSSLNTIQEKVSQYRGGLDSIYGRIEVVQTAQQTLLDLGFNSCTYGTTFIRECILGVMDIDCRPKSLNKTIYAEVSERNNTTLANLLRCTRTSLESAWKRRKKNKQRLDNGVCFDDFSLCPSVKEFIYYVAYKLNNYLLSLKSSKV